MKYIAIDIGSSFIKSAILDIDSFKIFDKNIRKMPNKLIDKFRYFEVDAETIFILTKEIIDYYINDYGNDIKGILLSTQMHGFVLANEKGLPVTNYISWQDERCLEKIPCDNKTYLDYLETIISRNDMKNTGVYIKPALALCNLFTLLKNGFVIRENTHFCTLGSYLIFRLTGKNICHLTNAAPTGFADVVNVKWSEKLIKKAGCDKLLFPELKNSFDVCAYYKRNDIQIAVYPDIGDQQACVLGCMARPEKDVNINIGTAAQIAVISQEFSQGYYEIRPFFDNYYLNTISRMPGGRNLDVLIEFIQDIGLKVFNTNLTKDTIWEIIIELAKSSDTGDLKVNTSFYKTVDSDSGNIENINSSNFNVSILFSAAFEDFAHTYNEFIDKVCKNRSGIERIIFSGGVACKNPVLLETICRITGLKGVLPPMVDEVFIGLFRVALICEKICDSIVETYDFIMSNKDNNKVKLKNVV